MKKMLLILFLLLFGLAGTVGATDTAVQSMSLPVWATDDDALIYTLFPQLTPDFSNRFVLEYGLLGMRGYLDTSLLGGTGLLGVGMPGGDVANGNNQFLVGYGFDTKLGKMGVLFSYGVDSYSMETLPTDVPRSEGGDENHVSQGAYQLILGLSTKVVIPVDLSFIISYSYNTISEVTQVDPANGKELYYHLEDRNAFNMHIVGRGKLGENWDVITGLGFFYDGYNNKDKNWSAVDYSLQTRTEDEKTDYTFVLGMGSTYKWKPASGILIKPTILGQVYFDSYNESNTRYIANVTDTTITPLDRWSIGFNLDFFIGGEFKVYKSWKFRAGLSDTVLAFEYRSNESRDGSDNVTDANSETYVNSGNVTISTGIGGKIGIVNIDMLLNTNFFLNGPYILSGVPSTFSGQVAFSVMW